MIRLSTAHARARLSKSIDVMDAKAAVEMVQFSHFKKVLEKPRKRKRNPNAEEESGEESEYESENENIPPPRRVAKHQATDKSDVYDFENDSQMDVDEPTKTTIQPVKTTIKLSEDRLKQFKQFLFKLFRKEMTQSLQVDNVIDVCRNQSSEEQFSVEEIHSALAEMQDNNQVFVSDGLIILV